MFSLKKALSFGTIQSDLAVGDSGIDRKGVFANRAFKKGAIIHTLQGKEISIPEIEHIYLSGINRISADGYQVSDDRYMFLDTFSAYINHSCNPTCGVIDRCTLIALRDVNEGEEISYDYSTVEWTPEEYRIYDYAEWPMVCRCGEPNCRKLITCFPCLSDSIKQTYISAGTLPDHIKHKLDLPKDQTRCLVCEHVIRIRHGMK
jgi:uncharacterized protein